MRRTVTRYSVLAVLGSALALGGCAGSMSHDASMSDGMAKKDTMMNDRTMTKDDKEMTDTKK